MTNNEKVSVHLKWKATYNVLIIFSLIASLYLINVSINVYEARPYSLDQFQWPAFWLTALGLLFGALTEWNSLRNILQGRIRMNWLLFIPAIFFIVVCFIPSINWLRWYEFSRQFHIEMLLRPQILTILNVFSGVLVIRSLGEK